jgi:hypothetical protein
MHVHTGESGVFRHASGVMKGGHHVRIVVDDDGGASTSSPYSDDDDDDENEADDIKEVRMCCNVKTILTLRLAISSIIEGCAKLSIGSLECINIRQKSDDVGPRHLLCG